MTMEKIPAKTGWQWLKQGFVLFRKQPAELSTLFLAYMFINLAMGIIPLFGQVLPLVLIPVFSMAFMQACVSVEDGKKVYPNLLLTGFRSPQFRSLVKLGVFYLVAAVGAVAASALVDGGTFWNVITGQLPMDSKTIQTTDMTQGMLLSAALYIPAAMAFWYAAPLIAWQGMGVGKAIFYSFFAVRRAGAAFLVYGMAWILVGVLLPAIASSFIALIIGPGITMFILLPLSMVLTVVLYCSFYPTYVDMFGKPQDD